MRNSIKKYIVHLIVFLLISIIYLIYCYLKDSVLNVDYIILSIFIIVVYSIMYYFRKQKGIMPSEKVLDFPVDCNTLTGSVNL